MNKLKYWLPPLLWMGFLFPLTNKLLSSPFFYRLNIKIWDWLFPNASFDTVGQSYIYFRKSLHFGAYALLAFLLFRFFRADRTGEWRWPWAGYSVSITLAYGAADELLQGLMQSRDASLSDFLMDGLGAVIILGFIFLRSSAFFRSSVKEPGT